MSIKMVNYGALHGEPLYEFTLTNRNGMQVKLLNYGATLEKVLTPSGVNLILSLNTPEDYSKERNFLGGTVGRYVGRLVGHTWQLGEKSFDLPALEGENAIHGGNHPLDMQVFTASVKDLADRDEVEFVYLDPAGELPGNVLVHVTYTLDDHDKLSYHVEAETDAMTLFNPTNHVYFALDGEGQGVDNSTLTLAADYYAPLVDHLPTNGWATVSNTPFDFRRGARLGDRIPQVQNGDGFDHPFLIHSPEALTLTGKSGRSMTLTTTAPAVVMYTANHFDHTGVAENIGAHDGVALEAQIAPVSGHDWSALTLLPSRPYTLTTSWQFAF